MAKRRANGEGNICKRSDGRWEGRYTAGRDPDTGKTVYKNVLAKTQKECKEKLKRAVEANAKVDAVRAEQYTVGQWMDVWFENCAKIEVRPSSHKAYRGYIDNHIKPSIGKVPLNKLSSLDLQKLYKKLLSGGRVERIESKNKPKGLSTKTVRNINQVISSAMDFAIDQKLISAHPTDGCALPKFEHQEKKTLPAEQLASFLHEAKESGVFERYYIELATGLRRGELLGLKWEDIDLEGGTIQVRRQIARINGEVVEAPLKTKNSYRSVSIREDAVEILREQREKTNSEYVFPSPTGGPNLTGQRTPYAPPGAEAGRTAPDLIPRYETYVRYGGAAKWSGHQDGERDAGPLQCRVHTGYLRPRDHPGPEPGGGYHGEYPL